MLQHTRDTVSESFLYFLLNKFILCEEGEDIMMMIMIMMTMIMMMMIVIIMIVMIMIMMKTLILYSS